MTDHADQAVQALRQRLRARRQRHRLACLSGALLMGLLGGAVLWGGLVGHCHL